MQDDPDSLTFALPNGITTTVSLTDFIPRHGYQFYDDFTDPPGTADFWIPAAPHDEIGYKWSGSNEKYDVLIIVHNGILNTIITGNGFRYGIMRVPTGDYKIHEYDYQFFLPTDILGDNPKRMNVVINKSHLQDKTFTSNLKLYDFHLAQGQSVKMTY